MADEDDDYVYDEVTGEWRPASEMKAAADAAAQRGGPRRLRQSLGRWRFGRADQGSEGQGRGPDAEAGHGDPVDPADG